MTQNNLAEEIPAQAQAMVAAALQQLVGELDQNWQAAVEIDPEFVAAYLDLARVPERRARLDGASRALISLAVSACVTTLDPEGIRTAAVQAREAGATREQALEVIQLVSVLGVHTVVTGFPEVESVAQSRGLQLVDGRELSDKQLATKEKFESKRGYWSGMNEMLLRVDHDWFAAYTDYSAHPWINGDLTPKLRELIYIAIDLSPTHLFTAGVGPHIENAFKHGASLEEIVETLEITALVGISSLRTAAPIIREIFG
ncbi:MULTISPECIES: carboxymuconolactone decarboxylase family protein [unclassified Glutamicibacter]|uniref:carboxymuconolactone decarboxylase family protein n=1 Tax=unclassified Glutamicibacter TaxID=2627139 RepID=UPI0037FE0181